MTSRLKSAAVEEAVNDKVSSLRQAAVENRRALDPDDLSNYSSAEEFEQVRGFVSPTVTEHFRNAETLQQVAQYENDEYARRQRSRKAWVSDEDLDTVTGQLANKGAGLFVDANRAAEFLSKAPVVARGAARLMLSGEKAVNAYNKQAELAAEGKNLKIQKLRVEALRESGAITDEQARNTLKQITGVESSLSPMTEAENKLLNTKRAFSSMSIDEDSLTIGERIEAAQGDFETASRIGDAFSNTWVNDAQNQSDKDVLDTDLSVAFEDGAENFTKAGQAAQQGNYPEAVFRSIAGVVDALPAGIEALFDNKGAVGDYIAENAATLAVGAISKTALASINIAYGTDIFAEAMDEFRELNNGKAPTPSEARAMLAISLSASAMEQVADIGIINTYKKAAKNSPKVGQAFDAIIAKGTGSALGKMLDRGKKAGDNAPVRTAGAVATGFAREAGTEVYQTAVEENFSKLNTDVDAESLFKAGIIGGAVGGSLTGAGRAARELAGSGSKGIKLAKDIAEKRIRQADLAEQAKDTGDIAPLIDEDSPDFNLAAAAQAVRERIEAADLTPEDVVAAKQTLQDLAKQQEAYVTKTQVAIDQAMARAQDPKTADDILTEAKVNELVEARNNARKQYQAITALRDTESVTEAPKLEEIDGLIDAVESPEATPERGQAAERTITLLMQNPDALSDDQLIRLNESTGLDQEQRGFLQKYTAAHQAINKLQSTDKVRSQVLQGRDGFKGITEYISDVGNALRAGDTDGAQGQVDLLSAFLKDHATKVKAVEAAVNKAVNTGKKTFAIRTLTAKNGWAITQNPPKGYNQGANGGFIANPAKSPKVAATIENMKAEVVALEAAREQLIAAIGLSQGNPLPESNLTPEQDLGRLQALADIDEGQAVNRAEQVAPAAADATPETTEVVVEEAVDISPEEATEAAGPVTETTPESEATADGVTVEPEAEEENDNSIPDDYDAFAATVEDIDAPDTQETSETVEPSVEDQLREINTRQELDEATPDEGILSVFKEEGPLSGIFTQELTGEDQGTLNPLLEVKDYYSFMFANDSLQPDYVTQFLADETLTSAQGNLLGLFRQFSKDMAPRLQKNLKEKLHNPGFEHRDYMEYFRGGNVEQNMLTAMMASGFSWLGENGATLTNNEQSIKAILGKQESEKPTPDQWGALYRIGTRESIIIESLGERAVAALGIRIKPGAKNNALKQLQLAMGSHILASLVDAKLVVRKIESSPYLLRSNSTDGDSLTDATQGVEDHTDTVNAQPFITIAQEVPGELPVENVRIIVDGHKETSGVLNKLFGIQEFKVAPETEPGMHKQTKVKRSPQKPPAALTETMLEVSKRPNRLNRGMRVLRQAFSRENIEAMAGVVESSERYTHEALKIAQESKNQDIRRNIDQLEEFDAGIGDSAFYLNPVMWIQQRVGLKSNLVDPQQNKFHRHNMHMEAWETKVTDKNLDMFKRAVAQGMGIDVDKMPMEQALQKFEAKLGEDQTKGAIETLRNIREGEEVIPEDQQLVVDAVTSLGEDFHSLDALASWADYLNAGDSDFTTTLMFEVDGVTNGPALAQILMGTGKELLNKFGMFNQGDGYSAFVNYKHDGNEDLYENVMTDLAVNLQSMHEGVRKAFGHFTGQLIADGRATNKGRKFVKQPLTAMVFGSGINKAISSMSDEFIENIYKRLQSDANENTLVEVQYTVRQVNFILPNGNGLPIPHSKEDAMALMLTRDQEAAIKGRFSTTVGKGVKATFDAKFGDFISNRNAVNEMAQGQWALYNAAYTHFYSKALDAKPTDGAGRPLEDLTSEEIKAVEEQVKSLRPVVHTALSAESGNLDEAMFVPKPVMQIVRTEDPDFGTSYSQENKFSTPVATVDSVNGKPSKSFKPRGRKLVMANPGVRVVIMLVHALDSAIASKSYAGIHALNVHDALGIGLKDIIKAGKALNENTLKLLTNYSLSMEVSQGLERTYEAAMELADGDAELASVLENVGVGEPGTDNYFSINERFVEKSVSSARDIELKKLTSLAQLETVDQYALENGAYEVSPEDRVTIAAKIVDLGGPIEETPTPVVAPESRRADSTPQGALGVAKIASDPALTNIIRNAPDVKTVMKYLRVRMKAKSKGGRASQFQEQLLDALASSIKLSTKIELVTPDTITDALAEKLANARGGYTFSNDGGTIYIKGPEFRDSGITPELLLHELTHAAVTQKVIDNENGSKGTTYQAVQELKSLHEQAKQYVADNDLTGKYGPAVDSIHETIAWGMTNTGFQTEVLAKIEMQVKPETLSALEKVETGLRTLIRNLTKIFFGKRAREFTENGMGVMIANTGLLLALENNTSEQRNEQLTLLMANPNPQTFTTNQIFNALGARSFIGATHRDRLQGYLNAITDRVYGEFGVLKAQAERTAPATAEDTYLDALKTGFAPYANVLSNNLPLSDQESFVAESIEQSMQMVMESSATHRNELRKLWQAARDQIKPADLNDGSLTTAQAERHWRVIFDIGANGTTGGNYLGRFLAAGLTYQPLLNALNKVQAPAQPTYSDADTFAGRVEIFFKRVMNAIDRIITQSKDTPAPVQLFNLAQRMAKIEAKYKALETRRREDPDTWLETMGRKSTEAIREGVQKAAKSKVFTDSKINSVKFAGAALATVAGDRTEQFMDGFNKIISGRENQRKGFFGQLIDEIRNGKPGLYVANKLLDHANTFEQNRLKTAIETREFIEKLFETKLTNSEEIALTRVALRGDLATLLDSGYSLADIEGYLSNDKVLADEITKLESQLDPKYQVYYQNAGRGLGLFMANGQNRTANLVMNAHNIANLSNTGQRVQGKAAVQAEAILDPLITLYSMQYMDAGMKARTADVLAREETRSDSRGSGFEVMLKMHQKFKIQSQERLFDGSPISMIKGYTSDVVDNNIDVKSAAADEGLRLEKAGYAEVTDKGMLQDPSDPSADTRKLYSARTGGMNPFVVGFMGNSSNRRRGTSPEATIITPTGERQGLGMAQSTKLAHARKQAAIANMFTVRIDPTKAGKTNLLAPSLNHRGEAVAYRYLMQDSVKDDVMKRDNRIGHVMGNMAGTLYSKAVTPGLNEEGVDAIKAQYDKDHSTNPKDFVEFSLNSDDPAIRERYKLLPDATKRYIRNVWGRNGMVVHKDVYNIAFGYRKYSLAETFESEDPKLAEKIFVAIAQHLPTVHNGKPGVLGERAALRVAQAEDVWQELVKWVKDIWVIKNLFTLLGNESSNMSLLYLSGVPLKDIIKDKAVAMRSTMQYMGEAQQLRSLQAMVEHGFVVGADKAAAEQEIFELEDSLARNPVAVLMDAGMFQTLIEDIDTDMDPYSFKSRLNQIAEDNTQWIPRPVKTVGKVILMTNDTTAYKVLNRATQLSDFTSRYVMYQHMTQRKNNRLSSEEALREARQAFVNYDVPTHKALQYLNDSGLLWFTKYYLRIQAVIFQLVKNNPVRAMSLIAMNSLMSFPDILDSNMLGKSPVNFGAGALEYPGAIDEVATIKLLLQPF